MAIFGGQKRGSSSALPFKLGNILDVLVLQGQISQDEAMAIAAKHKSSPEIEEVLVSRKLITQEDLAKAYAVFLGLPFTHLVGKHLTLDILKIIPFQLSQKYKLVAYDKQSNKVFLAIGEPAKLKRSSEGILHKFSKDKKIEMDLAVTTQQDIDYALATYKRLLEAPPPPPVSLKPSTGLPYIDLKDMKIAQDILNKFPKEVAEKYRMVVFAAPRPNLLKIAVENPDNPETKKILEFLRSKQPLSLTLYQTDKGSINHALLLYQQKPAVGAKSAIQPFSSPPQPATVPSLGVAPKPVPPPKPQIPKTAPPKPQLVKPPAPIKPPQPKQEVTQIAEGEIQSSEIVGVAMPTEDITGMEERNLDNYLGQKVTQVSQLEQLIKNGNVPQMLAGMIVLAVYEGASDIHIEPHREKLTLRFRIDGILGDVLILPLKLSPPLISRIKILAKLKIDESRVPQDGRIDVIASGREIDLRVSTLPTVFGEKAVLRILDKSSGLISLEQLGVTGKGYDQLMENIVKPYGVVLSTGPTGSGKSTTLYAILQKIATPKVNVVTLEDPVEYQIERINQCQIKPRIGFGFAQGLRSILRQDPNIIMVGEIRDRETAEMVTHSALTGHLVLTTLHTNDAAGALPRLINMGIEPFLITSAMNIIIAQRLVRKICDKCKIEVKLPPAVVEKVKKELANLKIDVPMRFYKGRGCDACKDGFKGRIGIFEFLEITDKIEDLVVSRAPANSIRQQAVQEGMMTMLQDGLLKVLKGISTVDEVFRVTQRD